MALKTREVQVPDLTNLTANEATTLAGNLGLTVKVDDARRLDPKIAAGRVMAQDPAAQSTARRQRSIRVWLSGGVHSATAPLLVGETERAAEARVSEEGIALNGVAEIRSPDYPPDVVVAQMPPAKTTTAGVALLVNRVEHGASYVMPDLIGVNGDRAAEILRGKGFRVAVVASNPYPGVAAGIVLRQIPQGGFRIAPGEPISLEVSR
jgi:serine/threonine-protein kinase